MKQAQDTSISGQQLVADFQSVLLSRATAEAASQEAERSETELMQQLSDASRGNFLNPTSLEDVGGDYVVRASLDAHIKKVQAEQLQSITAVQMQQIIHDDQLNFKGKRLRVSTLDEEFQPFDGVWFDQKYGYRSNTYKKKAIEGKIEEINFEKNLLLIKPKRMMRLLNSSLQYYVVYVINPQTLMPAVSISLL